MPGDDVLFPCNWCCLLIVRGFGAYSASRDRMTTAILNFNQLSQMVHEGNVRANELNAKALDLMAKSPAQERVA